MVVFISYAHEDVAFVNRLAAGLIERDVNIWLDRWQLHAGDSLNGKISAALRDASFLCVVLSKNSVKSEWCKSEINAGLLREVEEKRSVIIPILIEDCEVPDALKERLIVDFRASFTQALRMLITTLETQLNDCLGRIQGPIYISDFAIDWELKNNLFSVHIDAVQFEKDQEHSILTRATIRANRYATKRYKRYVDIGLEWFVVDLILQACMEIKHHDNVRVIISDNFPIKKLIILRDQSSEVQHDVNISIRRLGRDTGRDVLYNYGRLFEQIFQSRMAKERKFTPEEQIKASQILGMNQVNMRRGIGAGLWSSKMPTEE